MEKFTQLRIQKRVINNNTCQLILEPINTSFIQSFHANYLTFIFSENGQEIRSSFSIKNNATRSQTFEIEVNHSENRIPKFLTEIAQVGSILVATIM